VIYAVLAVGVLIAAMGAALMLSPGPLMRMVADRFQTRTGLYAAALLRVAAGVLLVLASPESRSPAYLWYFGVVVIFAGLALPLMGLERFRGLVRWAVELDVSLLRASGFVAVALGLSFVWAAL